MIVDKVNLYLNSKGETVPEAILKEVGEFARWSFLRQFGEREDKGKTLRLSSIGRCVRQQSYSLLGFEANGKAIDARAKMVFFQGDMAEMAIIQLARAAGCNVTDCGQNQKSIKLEGVEGHPDGIYHHVLASKVIEDYLLESKSMSSYGFKEFERGVLDDSYRYQINAYMEALALPRAIVIGLNKDAGVLHEMVISKDPAIVADIRSRILTIRKATRENLPPRPYHPNEKKLLPWNCGYCSFWKTCWPKATQVLVKNAYKLKVDENEKEKAENGSRPLSPA